jgi:hypothetical protein
VVDDHADGPQPGPTPRPNHAAGIPAGHAAGPASDRCPSLNFPDAFCRAHPRSARRFTFDRTPSTFAGTGSGPRTTAISFARIALSRDPDRARSTDKIRR